MKVDTTEIKNVLKRVAPALSRRDFLPALSCFAFGGDRVTAHDDIVAISAELPEGFTLQGCIRGDSLLRYLEVSAKTVTFAENGEGVQIKSGRSKLNLSMLSLDDFPFEMPDEGVEFEAPSALAVAFADCLNSLGVDPAAPERLGITLVFTESGLTLYASDNATLSRSEAEIDLPSDLHGVSVSVPGQFATLLVQMASKSESVTMLVSEEDYICASFDNGDMLFSKLLGQSNPKLFEDVFDTHTAEFEESSFAIPKRLPTSLDRVLVVAGEGDDSLCTFKVSGDRLYLHATSERGEVSDNLPLKCEPGDSLLVCPAARVARVIRDAVRMSVTTCIALDDEQGFKHLVASREE